MITEIKVNNKNNWTNKCLEMLPKWLQSVRTCLVQKKEETDFGSHCEVRI